MIRSRLLVLLLLVAAACLPTRAGRATDAPCCTADALRIAERHRIAAIERRHFTHRTLQEALEPIVADSALRVEEIGRSVQDRTIRAIWFGDGPTTVLLWSQMHGDESTATMALADILAWLAADDPDPLRETLRRALTIVMVPMLNPDGAERFQRENAAGIDINRDARRLASPEARALKSLRDRLDPDFGFNLHDQGARTLAGDGGRQAAIALLAPAAEAGRGWSPVRRRARLVAAAIAHALHPEIEGRIAKYDDTFNPRAFGDLMQHWGTSTVLIESGALPEDPEKQRLRALNVVAILSALEAIATRRYERADPGRYESLPFNARIAYDVLLRGGTLILPGSAPIAADLALTFDDPVARRGLRLREVGDLSHAVALDTVDVSGRFVHPDAAMLNREDAHAWLALDIPVAMSLRAGADSSSALVRRFGPDDAAGARR